MALVFMLGQAPGFAMKPRNPIQLPPPNPNLNPNPRHRLINQRGAQPRQLTITHQQPIDEEPQPRRHAIVPPQPVGIVQQPRQLAIVPQPDVLEPRRIAIEQQRRECRRTCLGLTGAFAYMVATIVFTMWLFMNYPDLFSDLPGSFPANN